MFDHVEDPIAINCDRLRILNPDTMLSKISNYVILEYDVRRLLNNYSWTSTLMDGRVRYFASWGSSFL